MTASTDSTRKQVLHVLKLVADLLSRDGESTTVRWPAACLLLQRAKGEEAATPGQPVAQSAFLEVFPR